MGPAENLSHLRRMWSARDLSFCPEWILFTPLGPDALVVSVPPFLPTRPVQPCLGDTENLSGRISSSLCRGSLSYGISDFRRCLVWCQPSCLSCPHVSRRPGGNTSPGDTYQAPSPGSLPTSEMAAHSSCPSLVIESCWGDAQVGFAPVLVLPGLLFVCEGRPFPPGLPACLSSRGLHCEDVPRKADPFSVFTERVIIWL